MDAEAQASLVSGKVRGLVNNFITTKRKILQAPPIPRDHMYKMEYFMRTGSDVRLETIVGFLPFCIYNYARFGDATRGNPKDLENQEATSSDLTLVEIGLGTRRQLVRDEQFFSP